MRPILQIAIFLLLSLIITSCLKTTEQIEREKKVDTISKELSQSHKTVADLMLQVKELQNKLNGINGQFEEMEYKQSSSQSKQLDEMKKQVSILSEQISAIQTENKALNQKVILMQETLETQKSFIEKVTQSLGKISETKNDKNKDKESNNEEDPYETALNYLKNKKYKKAKEIFLQLIDDKEQPEAIINKSHFQLGLIEFKNKKYDEALVFFSKVYTQYPESSVAPSALFYIGKSFKLMKKNEEANSSFSELIEKFPKAKEVLQAKKEMK
jgi:TolA-binding protein